MKLMLDPGHGGKDPGAVAHGLQEKHLTLDIAKRIKRILESEYEGVSVYMTRETDKYLSHDDRVSLANVLHYKQGLDLFLSVHINAGGGTGFESFRYTSASARSKALHVVIHPEIVATLGQDVADRGAKAKNLHVLRETRMPALLTENLFIDNSQDAARLKDPAFREKLARGHVVGLEKAFGLKRKAQPVQPGPFPDVPGDHWAAEAIRIVRDAGLMTGREDGTFGPNEPVTRAQLAAILARLMKD